MNLPLLPRVKEQCFQCLQPTGQILLRSTLDVCGFDILTHRSTSYTTHFEVVDNTQGISSPVYTDINSQVTILRCRQNEWSSPSDRGWLMPTLDYDRLFLYLLSFVTATGHTAMISRQGMTGSSSQQRYFAISRRGRIRDNSTTMTANPNNNVLESFFWGGGVSRFLDLGTHIKSFLSL